MVIERHILRQYKPIVRYLAWRDKLPDKSNSQLKLQFKRFKTFSS
ncbi:hypothetical protein DSUL_40107 [Desulfovibrionales bacterium]